MAFLRERRSSIASRRDGFPNRRAHQERTSGHDRPLRCRLPWSLS